MKKYVVDTNVIIYNSKFYDDLIKTDTFAILPCVLAELDTLKTKHYTIREFIDNVLNNKKLEGRIFFPDFKSESTTDTQLIEYCQEYEGYSVLSNDNIVLLKAKTGGVSYKRYTPKLPKAVDYSNFNAVAPVWGLSPKNAEQNAAISEIMNPEKDLIALTGVAGTGKTLCAIAAALELCVNKGLYEKIYITRPVVPLGNQDIGFLPGSESEKLSPWLQPILDNIKALSPQQKNNRKNAGTSIDYLMETGKIEMVALSFIRGRSLRNCIILLDEGQNMNIHELKALITRAGDNCKIIVTGDMEQVDIGNSGYNFMIKRFNDSDLFSHIKLTESVRSRLAKEAGERL